MEQVRIQTPIREPAGLEGLRRAAAAGLGGDAFLEIFQNMMQGLSGEGPGLTRQEDQGAWTGQEQDPNAQAMMGELAGMALLQPQPTGAAPRETQSLAQSGAAAAVGQEAGQAVQAVQYAGQRPAQARPEQPEQTERPAGMPKEPGEIPVVEARYTQRPARDGGRAEYQAEGRFRAAVETARRQISGAGAREKGDGAPPAAPAGLAEVRQTAQPERAEASGRGGETPPLARQIDQGVSEQLELGRKEFTLKLKPASLGEITVRLVEKGGKTTLSIVTASAETARAINSDLSALREAVRPMAVEVHEAVARTPEGAQAQPFGMTGQQFAQQFAQQQRQSFYHSGPGGYVPAEESGEAELIPGRPTPVTAGLDTYI